MKSKLSFVLPVMSGSGSLPNDAVTKSSHSDPDSGAGIEKKSKKIILLVLALAGCLAICSIALVSNRTANKKAATELSAAERKQSAAIVPEKNIDGDGKAKATRKKWEELITAGATNYAYGVLGGINNLSIVFTNKTDFPIEEMTAKLVYIKSNGKPWKTKYITVYHVPAHSEKTQTVAKVNRGKSVKVSLAAIVSKQMHFNYAPGKKSSGRDPYLSN